MSREGFRLARTQVDFLAGDMLRPGSNNVNFVVDVGAHGRDEVEPALLALQERHELLRVRLRDPSGGQRVLAPRAVELPVVAVDDLAEPSARAHMAHLARPFDFAAEAPLRAGLFRLPDGRHHLFLATHHAIVDGWSKTIVTRDLLALLDRRADQLPVLPATYADHVDELAPGTPAARRAATYWAAALADAPAPSLRPGTGTGTGRAPAPGGAGGREGRRARLRRVPVTGGWPGPGSDFAFGAAAVATVLLRLCGWDDMLLFTAVGNRPAKRYADVVGSFATIAPLRVRLPGAVEGRAGVDRLLAHLHPVRRGLFGLLTHQGLALSEIGAAARPADRHAVAPASRTAKVMVRDIGSPATAVGDHIWVTSGEGPGLVLPDVEAPFTGFGFDYDLCVDASLLHGDLTVKVAHRDDIADLAAAVLDEVFGLLEAAVT